ncbi:MAG: o-succinylbenzoate synthase [Sterolibacteriaceae bacterium MAG5]|nr:o-succinylbenzoate synthase [Candidatus Nitricoxidireducens bremensis]
MRIAAVRLHPYRLPLRRPWTAAATVLVERRGMLVALTDADGVTGWGDCAPLPSSGTAGHDAAFAALAAAAQDLSGMTAEAAAERLAAVPLPEPRWALETALADLAARRDGLPLARFLGGTGPLAVPVNAALGPLDAGCAGRAAAALARGFAIAKIKLGLADVDTELGRLRALAAEAGGLRLRLDANRAWADADAWGFLTAVADLPIDGVEEPLMEPTLERLAQLQAQLPFVIAVDESLPDLGVDAVLAAPAVRRLVVKPARIGGIAATLALARKAQQAGVELVLTSVVDSVVGVAAAAHLAAALPGVGLAHGLATGEWLATDLGPPLPIDGGVMTLPAGAGLGFDPMPPSGG